MPAGRISVVSSILALCVLCLHAQPQSMQSRKLALEKASEYYEKGLQHQQNDETLLSIVYFDSAVLLKPNFQEALFSQASSFERVGQFSHALSNYEQILAHQPGFTGARFRKAVCLYELKQYSQAVNEIDALVSNAGPGNTNAVFYRYSETDGLSISTDNQISAEYYLYRGLAYVQLKNYEKGMEDLDTAVVLSGGSADFLVNRGLARQTAGRKSEAETDYLAALQKSPGHELALLNLFTVNPAAAKQLLGTNAELMSGEVLPELLAQQAYLAYMGEDYPEALDLYTKALNTKPGVADWIMNRSLCLMKLGNTAAAEEDLLTALRMRDFSERVYLYLGNLYYLEGRFQDAVSFYNQFIALEPAHSSAYFNRGLSFDQLGESDKACADLQKALQLGEKKSAEPLAAICGRQRQEE